MTDEMAGKLAVVTGSSRGIGRAAALAFAARGCDVAVHYQGSRDAAEAVAAEIRAKGLRSAAFQADMAREADIVRLFEEVRAGLGDPDILVNNAGTGCSPNLLELTTEQWEHTLAVHVSGPFHCCRQAVPHMQEQRWGRIINISSVAGLRGLPFSLAYSTAKGAVISFTQTLARSLADWNILVNAVSPGITRTDFHKGMTEETRRNNIENRIPIHREGQPEDIGEAIAWLAGQSYITGENLVVDGGLTMRIV